MQYKVFGGAEFNGDGRFSPAPHSRGVQGSGDQYLENSKIIWKLKNKISIIGFLDMRKSFLKSLLSWICRVIRYKGTERHEFRS